MTNTPPIWTMAAEREEMNVKEKFIYESNPRLDNYLGYILLVIGITIILIYNYFYTIVGIMLGVVIDLLVLYLIGKYVLYKVKIIGTGFWIQYLFNKQKVFIANEKINKIRYGGGGKTAGISGFRISYKDRKVQFNCMDNEKAKLILSHYDKLGKHIILFPQNCIKYK